MCLYTAKVVHNRMPKIKPEYLKREQNLKEKFEEFHSLSFEHLMNNLQYFCIEFGIYSSDYDASSFGNVMVPTLTEIQEAQSSLILSFREVLNYWFTLSQCFIIVYAFLPCK